MLAFFLVYYLLFNPVMTSLLYRTFNVSTSAFFHLCFLCPKKSFPFRMS